MVLTIATSLLCGSQHASAKPVVSVSALASTWAVMDNDDDDDDGDDDDDEGTDEGAGSHEASRGAGANSGYPNVGEATPGTPPKAPPRVLRSDHTTKTTETLGSALPAMPARPPLLVTQQLPPSPKGVARVLAWPRVNVHPDRHIALVS